MADAAKARMHADRAAFYAARSATKALFHRERARHYLSAFGAEGGRLKKPGEDKVTNWSRIKVVFCDLDQTFYYAPDGTFERNIESAARIRAKGVQVVYATGNNLALAQAKFEGRGVELCKQPGIYCNGALVLGAGGKPVAVDGVDTAFAEKLGARWYKLHEKREGWSDGCGLVGLGAQTCYAFCTGLNVYRRDEEWKMRRDRMAPASEQFFNHMQIKHEHVTTVEIMQGLGIISDAFKNAFSQENADRVLSLILLLPHFDGDKTKQGDAKKHAQDWLVREGLFTFDEGSSEGKNKRLRVVCRHVGASTAIGPEIDMSPSGVNKGSAVETFLARMNSEEKREYVENEDVAACGDADNDLALFGNRESYEPVVRLAMPKRSTANLQAKATHVGECHEVFDRIDNAIPDVPPAKCTIL